MDDNSSGIYIIDSEYNIMTFNERAKTTYPELERGQKCYYCLMDRSSPCDVCPVLNQVQGPRTYLDPIRHIYETVDAVQIPLENGDTGYGLVFSTMGEREEFSKKLPTTEREFNELYEQEYYDKLTSTYSRRGFIREAQKFLNDCDHPTDYAILFFNLKNFKAINEMFSIEGGDALLQYISQILTEQLNPLIIGRIEADHAICMVEWNQLNPLLLKKITSITWNYSGRSIRLHANCGIYRIESIHTPVALMIDRAHLAKQSIIDEHTTPYQFFDNSMARNYINQAELLSDYKNAIKREEFQIYYQPVIETKSGKIAFAEALIRWNHPTKGFLNPGSFIPLLEKNGLIAEVDWYMFDHVIKSLFARHREHHPFVPVSINLSWQDFYNNIFIHRILEKVNHPTLPRGTVLLELTETSFTALEQNNKELMDGFHAIGTKLLLDDFGSGYSSFALIRDYDFDILKLDMSFIHQITTNPKVKDIIKAIITMCHQMGLKVLAEGIETKEEVDFLYKNNCDYMQGYYFSHPISEKDFDTLLQTSTSICLQK